MAPLAWFRRQFQREPTTKPLEINQTEAENITPPPSENQAEAEAEAEAKEQKRKIIEEATALEEAGLTYCAEEIKNFQTKFSAIDGADLSTMDARLAYIDKLKNLEDIDREWYEGRGANYDKEYGGSFISQRGIPEVLKENPPLSSTIKQFHTWHMAGSPTQHEVLRTQKYDIVGEYRHARVHTAGYPHSEPQDVPRLMELLEHQVENFSTQIENMKELLPPEVFEDKIFRYACYLLQRFTEIHPMADGNGRVARSLYEMIIIKHVRENSKYRYLPLTNGNDFSLPRQIKSEQIEMRNRDITNSKYSPKPEYYNGDTELSEFDPFSAPTMKALKQTDMEETVYEDRNFDKFVEMMKEWITQAAK